MNGLDMNNGSYQTDFGAAVCNVLHSRGSWKEGTKGLSSFGGRHKMGRKIFENEIDDSSQRWLCGSIAV